MRNPETPPPTMNDLQDLPLTQRAVIEAYFDCPIDQLTTRQPLYGHMAYRRRIITAPDGLPAMSIGQCTTPRQAAQAGRQVFAKIQLGDEHYSDDAYGSAHQHALSDQRHLDHEARALDYLNQVIPELVPQFQTYQAGVLLSEYLPGRRWEAPRDPAQFNQYVKDILDAFDILQNTPPPSTWPQSSLDGTLTWLIQNNWSQINFATFPEKYQSALQQLCDQGETAIARLMSSPLRLTHFDSQANNIGWHPEFGARLVDPSWLGIGPANADATMFLIDLAQSGHDVSDFMDRFNPDYAWLRAGNWLLRSTIPPVAAVGNAPVRQRQLKAALTTLRLLNQI